MWAGRHHSVTRLRVQRPRPACCGRRRRRRRRWRRCRKRLRDGGRLPVRVCGCGRTPCTRVVGGAARQLNRSPSPLSLSRDRVGRPRSVLGRRPVARRQRVSGDAEAGRARAVAASGRRADTCAVVNEKWRVNDVIVPTARLASRLDVVANYRDVRLARGLSTRTLPRVWTEQPSSRNSFAISNAVSLQFTHTVQHVLAVFTIFLAIIDCASMCGLYINRCNAPWRFSSYTWYNEEENLDKSKGLIVKSCQNAVVNRTLTWTSNYNSNCNITCRDTCKNERQFLTYHNSFCSNGISFSPRMGRSVFILAVCGKQSRSSKHMS